MQVTQDQGARPIKNWAVQIEDAAMQQAKNLARLPFIAHQGVALMPDAHSGKGSTIGSVIATEKAIIPAAVGVDLGCFRGDMKVPLLDGTQVSFAELEKRTEKFWVYSIGADQRIVPGYARCVKTRSKAEMMRVVVSGGEEIVCTPDHEFMLNDGTYRQAKDLKFNDSLMPLYRRWQTRDGYESVSNGKGSSALTHVMVWEACSDEPVPDGYVVHHKNHIHFDNRPENLELMTTSAHSAHHRSVGHSFDNADPVFQRMRMAGIARRAADPEKRAAMALVGASNIKRYMSENPEHFAASVKGNGQRGAPVLHKFNTSPRDCGDCGETLKNPSALRWHKQKEHGYNHKVLLTQPLEERADVFCLQVDEHHNFALAAGVFVHNCGMNAVRLSLKASDLPESLLAIRSQIERDVPLGAGGAHQESRKEFAENATRLPDVPAGLLGTWKLISGQDDPTRAASQLGTLGSGNHFIELCLDENQDVWIMLHSGSRGIGNKIGTYYIERAKKRMEQFFISLPDGDLAYLPEETDDFNAYMEAVGWAQNYALENRRLMMERVIAALRRHIPVEFTITQEAINCHHNYVERENHFGRNMWVTRKGAIRARAGDLGIIPGSMGQRSYIVRGKGNPDSYCSCSHGAGRAMSRAAARKRFSLSDLVAQTEGVECRKDDAVLDEIPAAYKSIDEVMAAQTDLVEVVHVLKQVLCVKGA